MVRMWLWLVTALAVVAVSAPALLADEVDWSEMGPVLGEQPPLVVATQYGGPTPAQITVGSGQPKLYDNTTICTVDVLSLAMGGASIGATLSVRDWFITSGGHVVGFDLYVVNGGPDAVPNAIDPIQFYEGTDAQNMGTPVQPLAFFRSIGTPSLSDIPVHRDPDTNEPRLMRVSVDYLAREYTVVDAEDGTPLIDPPVQDIGARPSFDLPAGKVGVDVKFTGELSFCDGYIPVCGVALASGGSGNENGLHMTNVSDNCVSEEWPLICDNRGWIPRDGDDNPVPCVGGDVCALNRPYYGVALALYIGPGEDEDGNNERSTADVIILELPDRNPPFPPVGCSGEFQTIGGFIGDNPVSYEFVTVEFFDCDVVVEGQEEIQDLGDGDIDELDWGCLQRCFGQELVLDECVLFDHDQNGVVDLNDHLGFMVCQWSPGEDICTGQIPLAPDLLQDVDIYRIASLVEGDVLSVLVEGDKTAAGEPVWDPYMKIFRSVGGVPPVLEVLEISDDYERLSFDAFTTIKVPQNGSLYVGISAAANSDYDPNDPASSTPLKASQAGGYNLTVGLTDPNCIEEDPDDGGWLDCFEGKHEPDDSMSDARARGALCHPEGFACLLPRGTIGDGAFSTLGQDVDIYQLLLDGPRAGTRSMTAVVVGPVSLGYDTVFDLAMGLYNSDGQLISTADQSQQYPYYFEDQSRPLLAAQVNGLGVVPEKGEPDPDGIYYLAIFGTDRGLFEVIFDDDEEVQEYRCEPIFPAVPPSMLNFPHGTAVAGTNDSDLRPKVGGRVSKPNQKFEGCITPTDPPPPEDRQCYKIDIFTWGHGLIANPPTDLCDSLDGDDSILGPCVLDVNSVGDRLATMVPETYNLGNGRYGGFQGDVDFFKVDANERDIIAVNVADTDQPPSIDNWVRSYLALLAPDSSLFADHDYSLEHKFVIMRDEVANEMASVVVGQRPAYPGGAADVAYIMVGIDNGNMLRSENTPIDANWPGTTLSRRFETQTTPMPREYNIGAAVMEPVRSLPGSPRMFVVPSRGADDLHPNCYIDSPQDGTSTCLSPVLELDMEEDPDPTVEQVAATSKLVIDGGQWFSVIRKPSGLAPPGQVVSANPIIAYDGVHLYLSVEYCALTGDPLCVFPRRSFWRIDPDAQPIGFTYMGDLLGYGVTNILTGMTELDGMLYALNATTNTFRWWDKTQDPVAGNGGVMLPIAPDPEAEENELIRWDDLDGDIGSDGTRLFVPCTYDGEEYGICVFTPNPGNGTVDYNGKLADPVTNPNFIPGPILGGIDVAGGAIVTSDKNGPTVQSWEGWNVNDPEVMGTVKAFELPRRAFLVHRLTVR